MPEIKLPLQRYDVKDCEPSANLYKRMDGDWVLTDDVEKLEAAYADLLSDHEILKRQHADARRTQRYWESEYYKQDARIKELEAERDALQAENAELTKSLGELAELVVKREDELTKTRSAAKSLVDSVKRTSDYTMQEAQKLHAESSPEALESKRVENEILTDMVLSLEAERDALKAENAELRERLTWKPIESAPRDDEHTQILTWRKLTDFDDGWTIGNQTQYWYTTSFYSNKHKFFVGFPKDRQPTHWMPLPPPPGE